MPHRAFIISVIFAVFSQPLAAQRSAWEVLVRQDPVAVDDSSISWHDRLILHALTPDQAELYYSGRAAAEELMLPNGQSLALFLKERLDPPAHVFVPLVSPCALFELQEPVLDVQRLESVGPNLALQGGSTSGCAVSERAAALLLQVQVESMSGLPAHVKLWSPDGPEPAKMWPGQGPFDLPLSYETTLVVPVCVEEGCQPGAFDLRVSEAAAVRGHVVGYFRPLTASDQAGGIIPLATEGADNSFFGTGAGANNTGVGNSFFGVNSGTTNTSGSFNSFFGDRSGEDNTTGGFNSFFGNDSGLSNTGGDDNSFFGNQSGRSNTTGSFNAFFGTGSGFSSNATENAFFGADSGASNTSASFNAFFGDQSGTNNTTGPENSFFGNDAGFNNTSGSFNAFFGADSGASNTTENNNTFIGWQSNGVTAISNATALGSRSQVSQSNSLVLGSINGLNGATADVRVGIGTDIPAAPLHVRRSDGTIQIIRAQSTGPEAVRNMMDLINNGIAQFRLIDTSPNGDAWQFSNTDNNLNISLQGTGSQEFLIENDGDVFINNGTVQVTSSRATKENFKRVDSRQILQQVTQLDISEWNYIKDEDAIRHIGPVSEDFYSLFRVGDGDQHITPTDMSGVALAAIQGLVKELESTKVENRQLKQELSEIQQRLERLESFKAGGKFHQ